MLDSLRAFEMASKDYEQRLYVLGIMSELEKILTLSMSQSGRL